MNIFTANSVQTVFKKSTSFLDFKHLIYIGSSKNKKICLLNRCSINIYIYIYPFNVKINFSINRGAFCYLHLFYNNTNVICIYFIIIQSVT